MSNELNRAAMGTGLTNPGAGLKSQRPEVPLWSSRVRGCLRGIQRPVEKDRWPVLPRVPSFPTRHTETRAECLEQGPVTELLKSPLLGQIHKSTLNTEYKNGYLSHRGVRKVGGAAPGNNRIFSARHYG